MATVAAFGIDDLERFSRDLRTIGVGADDMCAAGDRIARYLHAELRTETGTPECGVVLVHKTHVLRRLPERLRSLARVADVDVTPDTPCLTRLALTGIDDPEPEPSSIVLPLTERALQEQPVLGVLLRVMGVDLEAAFDPDKAVRAGLHHEDLNVFLVPELATSEWFQEEESQAQIAALGLRSLLGIGGALPNGDLFFVFIFTTVAIADRSADLMRSLAPAMKASLIPHTLRPFGD